MRVYSHSYWQAIFVQPIAAECWCGRGGKLSRILGKKNTIFNEHPVYQRVLLLRLGCDYVSYGGSHDNINISFGCSCMQVCFYQWLWYSYWSTNWSTCFFIRALDSKARQTAGQTMPRILVRQQVTDRHKDRPDRMTDTRSDNQSDRQTVRQTSWQTDKQLDRQTDRQLS